MAEFEDCKTDNMDSNRKDISIYSEYKDLKRKYNKVCESNKKYKNENAKLKEILNQFKDTILIQEQSKNNIAKLIKEIKEKYNSLIEEKNNNKSSLLLIEKGNSFKIKSEISKEDVINKLTDLESDYIAMTNNFQRLVIKYKILSQEYNKVMSLNEKLILIEDNNRMTLLKKKSDNTNTVTNSKFEKVVIDSYYSDYVNNNKSEPIPSFLKFINYSNCKD